MAHIVNRNGGYKNYKNKKQRPMGHIPYWNPQSRCYVPLIRLYGKWQGDKPQLIFKADEISKFYEGQYQIYKAWKY